MRRDVGERRERRRKRRNRTWEVRKRRYGEDSDRGGDGRGERGLGLGHEKRWEVGERRRRRGGGGGGEEEEVW